MRKFNIPASVLLFLVVTMSFTTTSNDKKVIHSINNSGDFSATIRIPDYKDSLKIMQITDSHISIADENEADLMKYGDRMHKGYMYPRKHYILDTSKTTFENLDDLLLKAKNENVDLLLLTGDIVNFPSAVSVKYVFDRLTDTGIPWLYIAGNHDWHYEGMPGGIDSLRDTWTAKSLLPLYNGLNPLFYSKIINGINFVGIENSTNEVNENQISFFKDQLIRSEPIILISHIPYRFDRKTDQPGMSVFMDIVSSNSDKITAIFTGHNHRFSFYFTGNMCQYTSMASFQGASFITDIKPIRMSSER